MLLTSGSLCKLINYLPCERTQVQIVRLHAVRYTRPCCHTRYGGHEPMIHWHADNDDVMGLQVQ